MSDLPRLGRTDLLRAAYTENLPPSPYSGTSHGASEDVSATQSNRGCKLNTTGIVVLPDAHQCLLLILKDRTEVGKNSEGPVSRVLRAQRPPQPPSMKIPTRLGWRLQMATLGKPGLRVSYVDRHRMKDLT